MVTAIDICTDDDDRKYFIMGLLWYASGIPDAVKFCVPRERVLLTPSPSHHQSHNETEKALFEEEIIRS